MKKVFRFIEKQLVDIYIIALDSFVPKEENISMSNKDYLAIDMSSLFFNNISQEGKQQILDYFKSKYNIEVMNASINVLKEKGLTSNSGNDIDLISNDIEGILLGILSVKFESETKVVIEGYWFFTSAASSGIRSTIILKDGLWMLQKMETVWIS